jgi:hypothetical protein
MAISPRLLLPALLLLGGCATTGTAYIGGVPSDAAATPATAPQRVNAVSDALGERMNDMVASRSATNGNLTH